MSNEHALTEAQKHVVEEVRNHLRDIHQIETSYLHDTAVLTRIALIKDIMNEKGMEPSQIKKALTIYKDVFLDIVALVQKLRPNLRL